MDDRSLPIEFPVLSLFFLFSSFLIYQEAPSGNAASGIEREKERERMTPVYITRAAAGSLGVGGGGG